MVERKLTAEDFKINVGATSYNDLTDKPTIPTALSELSTDSDNQRVSVADKSNLPTSAEKIKIINTINFTYTL